MSFYLFIYFVPTSEHLSFCVRVGENWTFQERRSLKQKQRKKCSIHGNNKVYSYLMFGLLLSVHTGQVFLFPSHLFPSSGLSPSRTAAGTGAVGPWSPTNPGTLEPQAVLMLATVQAWLHAQVRGRQSIHLLPFPSCFSLGMNMGTGIEERWAPYLENKGIFPLVFCSES